MPPKHEEPKTLIDRILGKFLLDPVFTVKILLIAVILVGIILYPEKTYAIFISILLPIIGFIFLIIIAFELWKHYVQQKFIAGITWVLLEIIPPREVLRSPQAMELFFTNALYHWSNKGWSEEYFYGAVWFWYSLEIVSIDGQVHFYIYTPTRMKELIETQMYAQYPQAQVNVVEDYTLAIEEKLTANGIHDLWGCEFKFREHDDAHPIHTYVDFGLDKNPKEEQKIDPISPVIELFGSLKKGEQMWVQIVVRPSKQEYPKHRHYWEEGHDWKTEADLVLEKITKPYTRTMRDSLDNLGSEVRTPEYLRPTIEGINRKMSKLSFDAGIRVAYIAKKEIFDQNKRRQLRLVWRQYDNPDSNGFERTHSTQVDQYPFSMIFMGPRQVRMMKNRLLLNYREREFFYSSLRHKLFSHQPYMLPWPISPWIFPNYFHFETFLLNIEELATIWHFPGQILKIPTLERIEAKESVPPTNLPT